MHPERRIKSVKIRERYWAPEESPLKIQKRTLERLRDMPRVDPRAEARKIQRESLRRIRATVDQS